MNNQPLMMPANPQIPALRFWLTRTGYGLVFGAVIATLNFAHYLPLTTALNDIRLISYLSLLPEWCGEGILLVLTVTLAERRVSPRELGNWQLALTVIVGAIIAVLTWQAFTLLVLRDWFGIKLLRDYMGVPVVWIGGVFFHGWLMMFFGGLAAAVYASRRRRARMLAALHSAELGRATAQQRLAEAKLAALQARVEPDYLLQALMRLEHSYEADVATADRLLDELIAYLRTAMAGMRSSPL